MSIETTYEQQLKDAALTAKSESIAKAQAAGNLSTTSYGVAVHNSAVIDELAPKLEEFITGYMASAKGAKASFGAAWNYLTTPDFSHTKKDGTKVYFTMLQKCQKLIVIGLSATLDGAYSDDAKASMMSTVCAVIGAAVEQECKFNSFKEQNEWLFNAVWESNMKDPLFGAAHAAQSMTDYLVSKDLVAGADWSLTSDVIHAKVGGIILQTILDGMEFPLFQTVTVKSFDDGYKTEVHVGPTDLLMGDIDKVADSICNKAFTKMPMLQKPVAWTSTQAGGYNLNGTAVNMPLIRQKVGFEVGDAGQTALNMLNNLQDVALTVNHTMVQLAQQCADKGISLGSFVVAPKKANMAQKKLASRKNYSNITTLKAAQQMMDVAEFFLPWSFDSRGRVYPQASVLHTQSNDFGKSLVMFAEPGPFNASAAKWLAIHLANTWGNGIDKLSLADRIGWVNAAGKVIIKKVASNPLAAIKSWTKDGAKSPDDAWQFIAAAIEWNACVTGKQSTTSVMVASDATCSGLQVLSGLMLDSQAAAYVNVVPTADGQLGDAYTACARLAASKFVEFFAIQEGMTQGAKKLQTLLTGKQGRKIAKKVVMTTPYNSGEFTQRGEIASLFDEFDLKLDKKGLQALVLAKALRASLKDLMPNVINGMEAISAAVFQHTKAGKVSTFSWTSPSGFKVVQSKFKVTEKQIKLLGSNQTVVMQSTDFDKNNPAKHKSATAPNFVHSVDGAMLHLTFDKAAFPFSVIHDSVLTRACDMEQAVGMLKQTFVDVFSKDVLGNFASEVGIDLPDLKGDLDVTEVLKSDYYFS